MKTRSSKLIASLLTASLISGPCCWTGRPASAANGVVKGSAKPARVNMAPFGRVNARLSQSSAGDGKVPIPDLGGGQDNPVRELQAGITEIGPADRLVPIDAPPQEPVAPSPEVSAGRGTRRINGHALNADSIPPATPNQRNGGAAAHFGAEFFDQTAIRPDSVRFVASPRDAVEDEVAVQRSHLQDWAQAPERTYVIAQSLSFAPKAIQGVPGVEKYDSRGLALVLEAMKPGVKVIFVTTEKVPPYAIRQLFRNVPNRKEVLENIVFVASERSEKSTLEEPLSMRLLRPENETVLEAIRQKVKEWGRPAALVPFISTTMEWELAKRLDIPLYSSHPFLAYWGTKSGSRRAFWEAGLPMVAGFEDIHSAEQLEESIDRLWTADHQLHTVMLKTNDGASGQGNTLGHLPQWIDDAEQRRAAIHRLVGHASRMILKQIVEKGGVVEKYVPNVISSPSGQGDILPNGQVAVLSTHQQALDAHRVYMGVNYPANETYRKPIEQMTLRIGQILAKRGVFGRFAVDFIAVHGEGGAIHLLPIEINLRTGGATHPYFTALYLTGAAMKDGLLVRPDGRHVFYNATEHAMYPGLKGIDMNYFMRFFRSKNILFNRRTGTGVVFHLMNTVPVVGNVGFTAIAASRHEANEMETRLRKLLGDLERQFTLTKHR